MSERDANAPLHCPSCGHDGVFDGMGQEVEEYEQIASDGRWGVTETRDEFHCPECGTEFLIVEDQELRPMEVQG